MCTLEIPQKMQHKFLLLTFVIFTLSFLLRLSLPQTELLSNSDHILYFGFAPSLICVDLSTVQTQHPCASLSFLNSLHPYYYFLNISKVILHHHLPGVIYDIIMSVCHESFMFFASLCILDVHLTSFHHASSRFLRVPACSSLGLLLIGPETSHLAMIRRWGNT